MIQSVLTIGAVLVPALLIISIILIKATSKAKYIGYFPALLSFAAGLVLLLFATIIDKTVIMGAGLGGWGIAFLFAGAVSAIVTSVLDAYAQVDAKA
ncbi:MAG TPA: hypothetical protein VK094_03155 [Pseudogracilibacillus sp.]|nr:hypothetical protein [Pseudogracilibacillus sp.]